MKVSQRAQAVEPSLTRRLFNMAKDYDNVIDLTLGDPDLPTPENIKEAGCKAIWDNRTRYSANAGLVEVREAVAARVRREWKVDCDPNANLILTVGGMEALYLTLACTVDPGDEVVVFAPYYVNYVQMIRVCGGVPVIVDAYDDTKGMVIDETALRAHITDKTVGVILNSPNNPTGALLSREDLYTVAKVAQEKNLLIISDEVYRTLIFDNKSHESVLQFSEAQNRTVLVDSMSKEYCMTGWRIGFAYAPAELIQNMVKMQENIVACAALPSQYAMLEAYTNGNQQNADILTEFQKRRDYLYQLLMDIPGLYCVKPQATFYLFLNIRNTGMTSLEFANALLKAKQVAVVPGEAYGSQYVDYVRIAFTKDCALLKNAATRIREFVKGE